MMKFLAVVWMAATLLGGGGESVNPPANREDMRVVGETESREWLENKEPASPEEVRVACEWMDTTYAESDTLLEQINPLIAQLESTGRSAPASVTKCVEAMKFLNVLRADICSGQASPDRSVWVELGRRMRHVGQACEDIAEGLVY